MCPVSTELSQVDVFLDSRLHDGSFLLQGALVEGYFVNVTLGNIAISVVSYNIEVESTTLGEAGNGVALVGNTGNNTISIVASFSRLELTSGEVTSINLHVPQVRHTTGGELHVVAVGTIQNEGVPSK